MQEFPLNAQSGGQITGEKGTVITFPENAFVNDNGKTASGDVVVHLKEYFDLREMLKSNVHTATFNKILVTGGSLALGYVRATGT